MIEVIKNLVKDIVDACVERGYNPFVKNNGLYAITRFVNIMFALDESELEIIDDYVYSLQCK